MYLTSTTTHSCNSQKNDMIQMQHDNGERKTMAGGRCCKTTGASPVMYMYCYKSDDDGGDGGDDDDDGDGDGDGGECDAKGWQRGKCAEEEVRERVTVKELNRQWPETTQRITDTLFVCVLL
jgi:hypothetical protein